MFNTIMVDLACPEIGQLAHSEIQIKWQDRNARALTVYHTGDPLEDLEPGYDDTWIRTDYICSACSLKTRPREGHDYIRVEDQRWHVAFVEIAHRRIARIVPEREFLLLGVTRFVNDVWTEPGSLDPADLGHQ
jgi:hypothetical protein